MKTIQKSAFKAVSLRAIYFVVFLIYTGILFAQESGGATHPGVDPDGMSVPIDGGILMALLAGSGLLTMLLKRKKKDE